MGAWLFVRVSWRPRTKHNWPVVLGRPHYSAQTDHRGAGVQASQRCTFAAFHHAVERGASGASSLVRVILVDGSTRANNSGLKDRQSPAQGAVRRWRTEPWVSNPIEAPAA